MEQCLSEEYCPATMSLFDSNPMASLGKDLRDPLTATLIANIAQESD